MRIKIVITGGTIDKVYDKIGGQLVFQKTHLNDLIEQARCTVPVSYEEIMLKDSLVMSGRDRVLIRDACAGFTEDRIIVTHGTDTIVETASLLGRTVKDKTIVLFGAMVPYAFGNSDALFNFGTAVAAVQTMPPGAYITMNGHVFSWDKVWKNREEGYFEFKDGN